MAFGIGAEEMDREIERAIIRSFGWAVIEFEAAIFQKFLVISGATSLMTEDMFKKHLTDMEAKGYVSPVSFHGKRAWKRLVIESEMDEPDLTPDEVRAFLEKAKALDKKEPEKKRKTGEAVVSESRELATIILQSVERGLPSSAKRRGTPTMLDHIEAMHHALSESRDEFLVYVKKNMPRIHREMSRLVDDRGAEMVLLSLRVIESGQRTYPPV
jgi:hypothetical protein